jgi:putative Mg2+ transporter-C (MgtC) family protein
VQQALQVRPGQIKRFLVASRDGSDEVTMVLTKVSSQDIKSYVTKLKEFDGVLAVSVLSRDAT